MFIKAQKEKLLSMLNVIQNAVSSKVTMQSLNNFYIGIKGKNIHLAATDLEIFVEGTFEADAKSDIEVAEGECTIPAKRFIEMVKEQEQGKVIEVKLVDGTRIDVRCGRSHFNLPVLSAKEYPEGLEFPKQKIITISAAVLKEMIEKTIFATSLEDIRYALNGVCFEVDKNSLKIITTDSRRLAFILAEIEGAKFTHSAVVPQKALNELARIIDILDVSEIKLGFSENQVSFQVGEAVISSRLVDGEFPNYERVIPKETQQEARLKVKELLSAVRQLHFLSQDKSSVAKFNFKKNLLTLTASVQGVGQGEVELDMEYDGKPLEIVFTLSFILDFLKVVREEELIIAMTSAVSPAVFSLASAGSTPNIKKYVYIVMPIHTE